MNGPVLTLLAVIIAALFATGGLALLWPNCARAGVGRAAAGLAGLAGMLALVTLLLPSPPAALELPVGLPGVPFTLALDPLSSGFLLLLGFASTMALIYVAEAVPAAAGGPLAAPPLALAGLALAVLAGDGLTLACGVALGGGAIWTLGAARQSAPPIGAAPGVPSFGVVSPAVAPPQAADPADRAPAFALLAIPLLAAAALVVAMALLAPAGTGLSFAAIRAHPPSAARATWAALVGIAGLGALMGLAPLHAWLVPAHRALPAHGAALLSGALPPVGLYALLRLVLDLDGSAAPAACRVPLLLAGAASILIGGRWACRDTTLDGAVAAGTLRQLGLAALGVALTVIGRAADLPNLTALAVAAVLLLACQQAVCGTLALLAAGAIAQQAGTRRLDRLGGLSRRMPVATAGLAVGLFGVAGLPPLPGFAALYLLVQAVLAGPRDGGLGLPLLLGGLVLLLALGSALAIVAATRLVGVVCLGRPRVPRVAAADEVPPAARPALLVPLAVACLLGVLPGPALRLVFGGAIGAVTGSGIGEHLGWVSLTPTAGSSGYAPLPLALLLALAAAAGLWLLRRRARQDVRTAPLWQDGFAAPPPWLPFGDPLTQWNGAVVPPWPRAFWGGLRPDRAASGDAPVPPDSLSSRDGSVPQDGPSFRAGPVPRDGPSPQDGLSPHGMPAPQRHPPRPGDMLATFHGTLHGWIARAGRCVTGPQLALAAMGVLLALVAWGRPP